MNLDYGIERIEIIYHGNSIIIEKDVDSIGEQTYTLEYKDSKVSFHELPTIKEAKMFACGIDSCILRFNPNTKGPEFE